MLELLDLVLPEASTTLEITNCIYQSIHCLLLF